MHIGFRFGFCRSPLKEAKRHFSRRAISQMQTRLEGRLDVVSVGDVHAEEQQPPAEENLQDEEGPSLPEEDWPPSQQGTTAAVVVPLEIIPSDAEKDKENEARRIFA